MTKPLQKELFVELEDQPTADTVNVSTPKLSAEASLEEKISSMGFFDRLLFRIGSFYVRPGDDAQTASLRYRASMMDIMRFI